MERRTAYTTSLTRGFERTPTDPPPAHIILLLLLLLLLRRKLGLLRLLLLLSVLGDGDTVVVDGAQAFIAGRVDGRLAAGRRVVVAGLRLLVAAGPGRLSVVAGRLVAGRPFFVAD